MSEISVFLKKLGEFISDIFVNRRHQYSDIFALNKIIENFWHFWILPTEHNAEQTILDIHEKRENDH